MVRRIAWILAIAGALVFAAMTAALGVDESRIRIPAITALVTFAAVVLSYVCGIEWGLALREEGGTPQTRAIALTLSSLPPLAAWGVLLWLPTPRWQVSAELALFVAVWAADLWHARHGLIPAWFVDLRTAITAVVAIILGVALYLL